MPKALAWLPAWAAALVIVSATALLLLVCCLAVLLTDPGQQVRHR